MKESIFGKSRITVVGLGGEGVLRTYGQTRDAHSVISAAIDKGIRYFDSARVYADSELYYGAIWGKDPRLRQSIFQTSKSASRDREGAWADLHESLDRLQTEYLDLWQIHDVRTREDLLAISRPGGALEAFVEARKQGLVRYIGVTGHHDPAILTKAVEEWPVDSVLLPVNPVEEILGGFLSQTLPAAQKKGIATIGMKVLGASHYILPKFAISPELLMHYALSYDLTAIIVGCATPAEVEILAKMGEKKKKLKAKERKELVNVFAPYAQRLAFYRGTL